MSIATKAEKSKSGSNMQTAKACKNNKSVKGEQFMEIKQGK